MPLREAILREIRSGALTQPWTTADLLENKSLSREFAITTLRTEPPNCSRSADGLALGDGAHSEDYCFYVRVGYESTGRPGKRALLYVVREEALAEFHVEPVATARQPGTTGRGRKLPTPAGPGSMYASACVANVLDTLHQRAVPLVLTVKSAHAAGTLAGPDAWYQASYPVLASGGPPKNVQDFIRVIAYAYSWLPTNRVAAHPTAGSFLALRTAVAAAGATATNAARRSMIGAAQAAISVSTNAVVTVSKVLHFLDPTLAPMYDVNVKRALASLQCTQAVDWLDPGAEVDKYLNYWTLADLLISAATTHPINSTTLGALNYRLLDELLFQLGKAPLAAPGAGGSAASGPTGKGHGKSKPRPATARKTGRTKKIDLARAIFLGSDGQPRSAVIGRFMKEAGLSAAGASTYYQLLQTESRKKNGERPVSRGKH